MKPYLEACSVHLKQQGQQDVHTGANSVLPDHTCASTVGVQTSMLNAVSRM